MSTIFPRWMNSIPTLGAIGGGVATVVVAAGVTYYFTPNYWRVGYEPVQPVNYSHQIHAGKLGIDCRYCHTHVEESDHSNVPDTGTCMNCHTGMGATAFLNNSLWTGTANRVGHIDNPNLKTIRAAYASGEPVQWKRVHKVPDYAHFTHSVHVNAGVSCFSCHGRVDQQSVVRVEQGMGMAWCLRCHRNPEQHLVDVDGVLGGGSPAVRVTDLSAVQQLLSDDEQLERGAELAKIHQFHPPENCGACHY